jgi:SH3 domain-containing YSC84-like protein 1
MDGFCERMKDVGKGDVTNFKEKFQRHSLLSRGAAVIAAMLLFATLSWSADKGNNLSDLTKRFDASSKVLDEVMTNSAEAIPAGLIDRAQCVAVFPSLVEVAALVGGKYGKGFMSCRTSQGHGTDGWSAPAPLTVTGGNWGAQFGGEEVDLVVIVMSAKGMQQLESGKFDVGVEASAAAGPVGTHSWRMNADVITYARTRGLFAGTNLDGSSIAQDSDDTRSLYGSQISLTDILSGKIADPSASQNFISKIASYAGKTRARD